LTAAAEANTGFESPANLGNLCVSQVPAQFSSTTDRHDVGSLRRPLDDELRFSETCVLRDDEFAVLSMSRL